MSAPTSFAGYPDMCCRSLVSAFGEFGDFAFAQLPYTTSGRALSASHFIKHWRLTQKLPTLRSAEAVLRGIVKGTAQVLGIQSVGRDFGLNTDSDAAVGICRELVSDEFRHFAVGQLWLQEGLRRGEFCLCKVKDDANPADTLTQHFHRDELDKLLTTMTLKNIERTEVSRQIRRTRASAVDAVLSLQRALSRRQMSESIQVQIWKLFERPESKMSSGRR